jgi:AraC family transcriptional activator of pobA
MPNTQHPLPVHSLSSQEFPVQVRRIEYNNPYDFTREHRHDYFEVFLFEQGGGRQLIDFLETPVRAFSSYIVFPQQIHLLNREPEACGRLVQFREEVIPSEHIRMLLRQLSYGDNPTCFFEEQPDTIRTVGAIADQLKVAAETPTKLSQEIALHYLQILLLRLLELREPGKPADMSGDRKLLFEFQQLLDDQYAENHSVNRFAASLNTTEKKLAAVTKKYLGASPLQVIHNRILLEAKRLLLFENSSHKEIAFQLGFDSPSSFSLFIKNTTGYSPSELNLHLVQIHK